MDKDCNIVRDLIPLYTEDIASTESGDFITEHCQNCEECRKYLEFALNPVISEVNESDMQMKKIFENIERMEKQKNRKGLAVKILCGLTAVFVVVFIVFFCIRGNAWFTVVNYGSSENYDAREEWLAKSYRPNHPSRDDVREAAEEVKRYFANTFCGCVLLNLTYDEEATSALYSESEENNGIVFKSNYYVIFGDEVSSNFTLMPDWSWMLEYSYTYNRWIVVGCGYG